MKNFNDKCFILRKFDEGTEVTDGVQGIIDAADTLYGIWLYSRGTSFTEYSRNVSYKLY
jgi:glutathione synthase/RimK-type ligase-like ATP-grasp enzyme